MDLPCHVGPTIGARLLWKAVPQRNAHETELQTCITPLPAEMSGPSLSEALSAPGPTVWDPISATISLSLKPSKHFQRLRRVRLKSTPWGRSNRGGSCSWCHPPVPGAFLKENLSTGSLPEEDWTPSLCAWTSALGYEVSRSAHRSVRSASRPLAHP